MLVQPKTFAKGLIEKSAASFGNHRWPQRQPVLWLLMYHRILPKSDPRYALEEPGMVVTPETFRAHLRILAEFFEFLPLTEWHRRAKNGKTLPNKTCAITFDDGWRDNYEYALPVLEESGTPATLFAVAEMIGTSRQFWPNRIGHLLTQHGDEIRDIDDGQWLRPENSGPVDREVVAAIIDNCKNLSDDEIESRLDQLESTLAISPPSEPALMDWQQLSTIAARGLVEIGSHTCNHRRLLAGMNPQTLQHEIVDSKTLLEAKLERPITSFCYPNGDYSPQAAGLVAQHYELAVTTRRGLNNAASTSHQLNRIGVHQDSSDSRTKLLTRLSGWR